MELNKDVIHKCADLVHSADRILIGAGAGMSAAAGIDYTDTKRFARLFPKMYQLGFRNNYQLFGFQGLPESVIWGYHAMHVQHVAFENQEHPVYMNLLDTIRDKDYFIMTSNVDGMFYKNHFDPNRIYTPQGDYSLMQCLTPCTSQTWSTRPFLDRLLGALDPVSHTITNPDAIPRCPNCGGDMFMNVRGGGWFIEEPYELQSKRLAEWYDKTENKTLVLIELGSGFNTPGVIRRPLEEVTAQRRDVNFIRVNQEYPDVPNEIKSKSIPVRADILNFINALQGRLKENRPKVGL